MDIEHGTIEGPFRIEKDLTLHGMITRGATVAPGVTFFLHGMVTGDLTIDRDAVADLHGTVSGTVRNYGGRVTIHGVVDDIDAGGSGIVSIMPGAIVKSRKA